MKFFRTISCLFLLTSCATAYQPQSFTGGFTDTQLDTNVFKVTFKGNGVTQMEKAEDLALLRSAELTLKNGFSYFQIIENQSYERNGSYTTPSQSYSTGNARVNGNRITGTVQTTTTGGQSMRISKPSTTNTIICFNEKPESQNLIYDAEFICKSLGNKYKVACNAN